MSKGSIAFIVAAVIMAAAVTIFMTRSAVDANERQHQTIEDFNKVDEGLKRSAFEIDSANKILLDSLNKKLKR
jgi:hypothetical protein